MTGPLMNGHRWFIVGLSVTLVALCAGLWIAQQPHPRPTPTIYTPVIATERDITGVNPCALLTPDEGARMLHRAGPATIRNLPRSSATSSPTAWTSASNSLPQPASSVDRADLMTE